MDFLVEQTPPQIDMLVTIIPQGQKDPEVVLAQCRRNGSTGHGLEGDPEVEYFCVQLPGRPAEIYTERALRASL